MADQETGRGAFLPFSTSVFPLALLASYRRALHSPPPPTPALRFAECTITAPLQLDWGRQRLWRQQGLYDRLTNGLSAWRRLIPLPSMEAAAQRPTVSLAEV